MEKGSDKCGEFCRRKGNSMKILGISLGHDTNFTLLEDGEIIEVREAERFHRKKRYKLQCDNLEDTSVNAGFQYINSRELRSYLIRIRDDWGADYRFIAVQNQYLLDPLTLAFVPRGSV